MANTLDARETSDLSGRADAAFAGEVGRMVRVGRAKRGMSRRQLAQESGTSERYLAQIESGAGNPSVLVMRAIADALEIPLFELLPQTGGLAAPFARIIDLLGRASPSDLSIIADTIERRIDGAAATDRGRRIALVGLRGAGKSTLGKMLAEKLGVPFIELDRMVEQEYGASVPLLIEMSGLATFRRHERACLERVISENEAAVIATAGGIVVDPQTFGPLLVRTPAGLINGPPGEAMKRVEAAGSMRRAG